ncbi:MAG TPA: FAD-dependent oxidoreductase [Propionibacteriaceae bacterium]|nr:FAD-dependent oxidoreductase [Propionibacteriaceae bacterium]
MTQRLIVVGGDAAGMSAASQAKRMRKDDLEVVALERSHYTSYSACGIPYWVGGEVDGDRLVARTPEQHRANGIDLRMRIAVESVDLDTQTIKTRNVDTGTAGEEGFDHLVIATGAEPIRPDLPGIDAVGIFGVQTLDDGGAVIDYLNDRNPKRVVVVGGGYIGIEMAEAMANRGLSVTVVDQAKEPMTTLDPDMGRMVHEAMEGMGIDVRTACQVDGFAAAADGHIEAVSVNGTEMPADIVICGLGVKPNTALAKAAGLRLGSKEGLRTDLRMRVEGMQNVWAGGDCVESRNLVSQDWVHAPLGTHANKQGRVIGTNLGGGYATFPGVVGTAMSKVMNLEIARTGLRENEAEDAGYKVVTVIHESTTRAGYYPDTSPITVKLIAELRTGRLLGGQIVGRSEGAAKRIDTLAVALWNRMTVEEITALDLGYAPPFSPVWDPVLIAARKATEAVQAGAKQSLARSSPGRQMTGPGQ